MDGDGDFDDDHHHTSTTTSTCAVGRALNGLEVRWRDDDDDKTI